MPNRAHIPPLRFHFLTPWYDRVVGAALRERSWRRVLLGQVASLAPGRVLDVGCGTGTLALALRRALPAAALVGIDADARALGLARAKAAGGAAIGFVRSRARDLPFAAGSFPAIVSSLFFHHLTAAEKLAALAEMRRVLAADGDLLVADWGEPGTFAAGLGFGLVRLLDGFEPTADAAHGRLPAIMRQAGFARVAEVAAVSTALGTIRVWRAKGAVPRQRGRRTNR